MYLLPFLGLDGGNAISACVAAKQQFISLQHDRPHHLGRGTAVGHLIQVDVAAVGKIQFIFSYTSCRVRYADPATGQVIEGTAYAEDYKADSKNNQQLEVTAKVASIAEAQTLAAKQLRLHNKYSRTATFTFPGDPSKVAGVTATLEGWGAWDGKYIIKQSKHSLGSSGYTTQTVLRRILEGY